MKILDFDFNWVRTPKDVLTEKKYYHFTNFLRSIYMDFKKPKELEVDYIDIRYPSRYGKYVYISSFFGDNRLLVVDETLYEYIKHISLEDIYKVSVTHTGNSEEVISVLLQIKKGVYEENE